VSTCFFLQASDDYERMVEAEAELQKRVLGCFADATTAGDASEVAKQCALLGPLGLAKEGVEGYLKFAKTALAAVTDEAAATGAALSVSTSNYKDPVMVHVLNPSIDFFGGDKYSKRGTKRHFFGQSLS